MSFHKRKNCLFAGSDGGGERAASSYSLDGPAKLNSLAPEACLRAVVARIAEHPVNCIQAAVLESDRHACRNDRSRRPRNDQAVKANAYAKCALSPRE
jgi:hypothetical protein